MYNLHKQIEIEGLTDHAGLELEKASGIIYVTIPSAVHNSTIIPACTIYYAVIGPCTGMCPT